MAGELTSADLEGDWMRVTSILYHFTVMGEASNRLGRSFHTNHPEVPWRELIGFRNVVVHGYDKID